MARKTLNRSQAAGTLRRAAASVKRIFTRHRKEDVAPRSTGNGRTDVEQPIAATPDRRGRHEPHAAAHARPARREPDIAFERFDHEYVPMQTGLKSGFRSDGSDMQRDQEFASNAADERWNDEDQFTNRSGDPRIGTHGRSYEPGERNGQGSDED